MNEERDFFFASALRSSFFLECVKVCNLHNSKRKYSLDMQKNLMIAQCLNQQIYLLAGSKICNILFTEFSKMSKKRFNIQGVPPKTGHFWAAAARPVTQLPRRSSSHRMQNLQELLLRGGATRSDVFWPRYRVFSKKVGFFLQIPIKLIFDIFCQSYRWYDYSHNQFKVC